MPHSTQNSNGSAQTFDLTAQDETPQRDYTMQNGSRATSGTYGVAVTSSSPAVNGRALLPSQQPKRTEHGDLKKLRRRSEPGTVEAYAMADMIAQREGLVGLIQQHQQARASHEALISAYNDTSKRRTQFYEEQFQYKDNTTTQARERVQRHTPVIAELKTNVIIKDEFTLITDLSNHLAQRYTRPDSSIMIKVDHSACIAMGGSFDPCYLLTINAVASQMGSATNKRNATLIQAFMADILSVPPERGILTFCPVPEENLATGGCTVLAEMEKAEKVDRSSIKKALDDAARRSMTFKKSVTRMGPEVNGNTHAHENGISRIERVDSRESLVSNGIERPKTAHGSTAPQTNGLRMNPISAEELRMPSSSLGRPKSVGAPTSSSQPSLLKHTPISNVLRQTSPAIVPPPRSSSAKNTPAKPQNISLAPQAFQVKSNAYASNPTASYPPSPISRTQSPLAAAKKESSSYADMMTALPLKSESSIYVHELDPQRVDSPMDNSAGTNPTGANSSKRRSATLNGPPRHTPIIIPSSPVALPQMPQMPPRPATPEQAKSMTSRLTKRKSFMKIFRRDAVPPWYKQ